MFDSHPILLTCLRSYSDWSTQDSLGFLCQRLGGFFSISAHCVDYYVPECHAYLLYMIDSELVRQRHLDYVK